MTSIVAAGAPSREAPQVAQASSVPPVTAHVDPSTLPVTVDADVAEFRGLAGSDAQDVGVTLAENLETETQALLDADEDYLSAVDFGERLVDAAAVRRRDRGGDDGGGHLRVRLAPHRLRR